ncbi:hypothetical protein COOONC_23626 [Cooperia oncophora]
MWTSWFGGFAEPSDYATAEMPDINVQAVIVSAIFVIPYLAFLVILPGVREKRLVTLAVITVVTLTGAILAVEEMVELDKQGSRIDMSRLYYNENFDISGGLRLSL